MISNTGIRTILDTLRVYYICMSKHRACMSYIGYVYNRMPNLSVVR